MDIRVEPGKYVLGVSGGVDSMVLLDILRHLPDVELVVAYYDHGIRVDSDEDRKLVQAVSENYNLQFMSERGELGTEASEALAREKRYGFLYRIQKETGAQALMTAHHLDDVLETAIINLTRGTSSKGLASLGENNSLRRPLLAVSKQDILAYAKSHAITWREDSTNSDQRYLRNYIRHVVMPKLGARARDELLKIIRLAHNYNQETDKIIGSLIDVDDISISRSLVAWSEFAISCEIIVAWLRAHRIEFDRKSIERIVVSVKTLPLGKHIDIPGTAMLRLTKEHIILEHQPTARQM